MVKRLVQTSANTSVAWQRLSPSQIQACFETLIDHGDMDAAHIMGRALCGISVPGMSSERVVEGSNLRKGAALLLRAADAGCHEAWMNLHWVHADHRCSVANPQLSRFFLEKAAAVGNVEAQRRLGALLLKTGAGLRDSESANHWLSLASSQGDLPAQALLRTLVLPVDGDEGMAKRALEIVRASNPWLAARLRLSRDFGLTKLEALCVDPVAGKRAWGLVVGPNPFIVLSKLAAPRAVPALTPAALETLHRVSALFESSRLDGDLIEGDWRRRSLSQRRLFAHHNLDESLFFAKASSATLDSLRTAGKWALRAREPLKLALAASVAAR